MIWFCDGNTKHTGAHISLPVSVFLHSFLAYHVDLDLVSGAEQVADLNPLAAAYWPAGNTDRPTAAPSEWNSCKTKKEEYV